MACEGCYICCDANERHNYPIIEKIKVDGAKEHLHFLNGIYCIDKNITQENKPTYTKKHDNDHFNDVEVLRMVNGVWDLGRLPQIWYINQNVKCPFGLWIQELNNNTYTNICNDSIIVEIADDVIIKPAK